MRPVHFREWRDYVRVGTLDRHNMFDGDSSHDEGIGDQRAMTPPGHRLSAHDGSPFTSGSRDQRLDACFEFRGLHIIGEPAE